MSDDKRVSYGFEMRADDSKDPINSIGLLVYQRASSEREGLLMLRGKMAKMIMDINQTILRIDAESEDIKTNKKTK